MTLFFVANVCALFFSLFKMHLHCFCKDGLQMFEFLTLDLVLRLFGEHIGHGVVPAIALGLVVESLE